jgi:hypothetical protein
VFEKCLLIIAGGYDPLNSENEIYYNELIESVQEFQLNDNVIFLKSPSKPIHFCF